MTIAAVRYDPRHKTQVGQGGTAPFDCSAYSLAMAVDAATLGGCQLSGSWVRQHSSEPVPDPASPGLRISQLVEVARSIGISLIDRTGHTFDDMVRDLSALHYIILQGDADQLPNTTFNGPHAIVIWAAHSATVLKIHNPLDAAGKDMSKVALRHYAEKLGAATGLGKTPTGVQRIRYAITRITPKIAKVT